MKFSKKQQKSAEHKVQWIFLKFIHRNQKHQPLQQEIPLFGTEYEANAYLPLNQRTMHKKRHLKVCLKQVIFCLAAPKI